MRSDRTDPSDSHQVIMFRPRRSTPAGSARAARNWSAPTAKPAAEQPPALRLVSDDDGRRHRLMLNLLGLAFCAALAFAGVWLVNEIIEMKRTEECVLSGHSNCLPLRMPARPG